MQTPQILQRDFNGCSIRQNHLTKMFNANDLMNAFKMSNPTTSKSVVRYTDNESTKEFIETLIHREGIGLHLVITTKRGLGGGTWMHPYLFLDFAMWLSPDFKLIAIKWIYDNLCLLRDTAGEEFKELNSVIKDVLNPEKPYVYSNECRMLQSLAGVDIGGRNVSDVERLDRLNRLQAADIKLLKQGVLEYQQRKKKLVEFSTLL